MILTTEQIEQILEGVPEGATHYAKCCDDYLDYENDMVCVSGEWVEVCIDAYAEPHDLSDLQKILTLRQRVQELEKNLSESDYTYDQSISTLRSERDELAAALALAKQMFHDYEMEVDCPAPTEHSRKMDKMYAALAEHDAEVVLDMLHNCNAFKAFPTTSRIAQDVIRVVDIEKYAERVKRGELNE